ncbi:MAG: (Fe-S)-binding protein [Thermodesulfovibrionales bacterium]|jgi:glycolate oxidase iron-sulfur subunit
MNKTVDIRQSLIDKPLPCVKCGSCKALCPVYADQEEEGMGARGRVVLLKKFLQGEIGPSEVLDKRIFSCLLCGACNRQCPLGIEITEAVYKARGELKGFNRNRMLLGMGMNLLLSRLQSGFRLMKFLEQIGGMIPLHRLRLFRELQEMKIQLPPSPLRSGETIFRVSQARGRVAVFAGCTTNFLYPEMGRALVETLKAMKYDVLLPQGEVCCGAPLRGLGFEKEAARLAEKNLKTFQGLKVEAVIGLCPTCVHVIRDEYKSLAGEGVENAVELSRFLSERKGLLRGKKYRGEALGRVVYHDPCHSLHHLNAGKEPREILAGLGLDLMEAERGCCGFGGTFRLLYKDISDAILWKTLEGYKGADTIVTSCPNCVLQFRSRAKGIRIRHLVEIIEDTVRGAKHGK